MAFPQVREQMHAACALYNNTSVEKYYIRAYEKGHLCKALNLPFTFIFTCLLSLSSIYFHCITFYNTSYNIRAQMRRVTSAKLSIGFLLSLSFFYFHLRQSCWQNIHFFHFLRFWGMSYSCNRASIKPNNWNQIQLVSKISMVQVNVGWSFQ